MLLKRLEQELEIRSKNDNMRSLQVAHFNFNKINIDDVSYLNLSSNDYLSINAQRSLKDEFLARYKDDVNFYFSSSSSRLLTGNYAIYTDFENKIGKVFNKSALYLNSGFDGNAGAIQTLFDENCLILADKLVHASMIDGFMHSKAKFLRFKHNDLDHLKHLIDENKDKFQNIIILVESLYSMDGDLAPLFDLVKIKQSYKNIYLYVDEAHSFSIYGDNLGLCHELNIVDSIDFLLLTLGKGFGSCGAVFLANKVVIDYLINHQRSFIFTTALAPVNVLYSSFILDKMLQGEFKERAYRLIHIAKYVRDYINSLDLEQKSDSHIIPLMTYSNERAIRAFNFFKERGFYIRPIRYPTVALKQSRLRLSLQASLTDADINKLCECIKVFKDEI